MDATDARTIRTAAFIRLGIGLVQGIVLFLLQKADESKACLLYTSPSPRDS